MAGSNWYQIPSFDCQQRSRGGRKSVPFWALKSCEENSRNSNWWSVNMVREHLSAIDRRFSFLYSLVAAVSYSLLRRGEMPSFQGHLASGCGISRRRSNPPLCNTQQGLRLAEFPQIDRSRLPTLATCWGDEEAGSGGTKAKASAKLSAGQIADTCI